MDLAERHVVITGAAGGLGPAVVERMLAAGAICHLPVRADADRLPRHARILAVEGVDLTNEAAVTSFYALPAAVGVDPRRGRLQRRDARRHAAGRSARAARPQSRHRVPCCREAVRNMRAKAAGGRLVNVSARTAAEPAGGSVAYITSKAAVSALVRASRTSSPPSGSSSTASCPRPSTRPPTARRCPTSIRPSGRSRPTSRR